MTFAAAAADDGDDDDVICYEITEFLLGSGNYMILRRM